MISQGNLVQNRTIAVTVEANMGSAVLLLPQGRTKPLQWATKSIL
jgi:hypothetical protein